MSSPPHRQPQTPTAQSPAGPQSSQLPSDLVTRRRWAEENGLNPDTVRRWGPVTDPSTGRDVAPPAPVADAEAGAVAGRERVYRRSEWDAYWEVRKAATRSSRTPQGTWDPGETVSLREAAHRLGYSDQEYRDYFRFLPRDYADRADPFPPLDKTGRVNWGAVLAWNNRRPGPGNHEAGHGAPADTPSRADEIIATMCARIARGLTAFDVDVARDHDITVDVARRWINTVAPDVITACRLRSQTEIADQVPLDHEAARHRVKRISGHAGAPRPVLKYRRVSYYTPSGAEKLLRLLSG